MTKYSDIEIQTAENLLKEGYKWIVRYKTGRLFAHSEKPSKVDKIWWTAGYNTCVCHFVPIFQSVKFEDAEPTSLESIVHPQILDDAERRYLKAVIRPFRDIVKYIAIASPCCDPIGRNYLYIRFTDGNYDMSFPVLHDSNMYKGMELDHAYSLEELGL